ncbi:hypothetical protein ACF07V_04350 [Streptomyces sp. NPDC015661]
MSIKTRVVAAVAVAFAATLLAVGFGTFGEQGPQSVVAGTVINRP